MYKVIHQNRDFSGWDDIEERHFSYQGRDFVEYRRHSVSNCCGFNADSKGSLVNQLTPEKKTILWVYTSYTNVTGWTKKFDVNKEYYPTIDRFVKENKIETYCDPTEMKEEKLFKMDLKRFTIIEDSSH